MSFLHINFTELDTQISQFARAIALPIRVFILRMITENGNALTKQAFYTNAFKAETVNKHLSELRSLGIVKVKMVQAQTTYYIDQKLFDQMSANFIAFFEQPVVQPSYAEEQVLNEPGDKVNIDEPSTSCGEFIKRHRMELNLSQASLAAKIGIDRALLSRIESGRKAFNADKLPLLAKALFIDINELKHIFVRFETKA